MYNINSYYKGKLLRLPQNLNDITALQRDATVKPDRRPRLAILVDQRGWAFHEQAQLKVRGIEKEWDAEFFFLNDEPVIDPAEV